MLTSPTHLRDKLLELDNDLGGLNGRRVALLGFRDSNPRRVDENLRALRGMPGWVVIDHRNASSAMLSRVLEAPKLALVVDPTAGLPTDASLLIRAIHDSYDEVRWADGTESRLPANRVLYVVAAGARSLDELPTHLQRIDFMTFIEPRA